MIDLESLLSRAKTLRLTAVEAKQDEISLDSDFAKHVSEFMNWEIEVRNDRKFRRQVRNSRLHKYRRDVPLADFDWSWPETFEGKEEFRDLFSFEFLKVPENVILIGPNGLGKTALLKNLVQEAVNRGHSALFIEAAELLDELANAESRASRKRLLEKYSRDSPLGIDELGYMSYDANHADLLFQLIQKRSGRCSTALTTNRDFGEWPTMFPNTASVTALLDRLIEKCTTVRLSGSSYRTKIQKEHQLQKSKQLPKI